MKKSESKTMCCISPMDVVADSHVGFVREVNEDSYVYCVNTGSPNALVAVADGIGGHEGGDVASALCMRTLASEWRKSDYVSMRSPKRIRKFLETQVHKANQVIFDLNKSYNIQHPMGTTIVAGIFSPRAICVAHAGDSRCYRLRDGALMQLTQDHSYVAELVRNNLISLEEARVHPFSHIISRSVGPVMGLDVELKTYPRKQDDRYLFCSDGLTAHLENVEIETIMSGVASAYDAVRELLYASLRGGGEDNITVLCVFT